ncbi:MAG: hypothetical protein AB8H79_00780, partial [Myxococcota bacterium]
QTDVSIQTPVAAVDVLWVIDNSCSMSEEQAALGRNFGSFINFFVGSDLDYHVGVVSTSFGDAAQRGRLRDGFDKRWIDSDTADPVRDFRRMAEMGIDGSGAERGRDQAWGAIELIGRKEGQYNYGFYRDDASLAIIVISDEDDYSSIKTVPEFADWMKGLKSDPGMVTFSSIVGFPGGCAIEEGRDYLAITRSVGGIEWDICNSDWSQVLEDLGVQAAGLKREFFLSAVPVEGTIEVRVDTDGEVERFKEDRDFTYSRVRNSIEFIEFVPQPFADVSIEYQPLSEAQRAGNEEVGD